MVKSVILRGLWIVLAALLAVVDSGCTSCEAIPAGRMPPSLLAKPRADLEQINFIRLRQDPPPVYQLGPRDILGIYIEGVLGQSDQPPPVHFPEKESNIAPAIGFPIPVREDGTISLPLIPPIRVAGLTLTQAEDEIRLNYTEKYKILPPGRERIVVTMIRPRTYQVLVVREDSTTESTASTSSGGLGSAKRGLAKAIDLKAYENDVLHALSQSGGLPGLDAKDQIKILRGAFADAQGRAALLSELTDSKNSSGGVSPDNPNVVTIPLRLRPSDPPSKYTEDDIILTTGDIVFIETREREVFYTGGLLQGKEMLLPRDYDLDVMGAIAVAGGNVSSGAGTGSMMGMSGGGGGGLSNARGLIPPTQVIIVRTVEGGYQIPIRVNLRKAQTNPAERILIKPGDLVLLQYTPAELITNIALNNIQLNYFLNGL